MLPLVRARASRPVPALSVAAVLSAFTTPVESGPAAPPHPFMARNGPSNIHEDGGTGYIDNFDPVTVGPSGPAHVGAPGGLMTVRDTGDAGR